MKSVPGALFFKPMKEEPIVFPFGTIAELIVVPKRPYLPGEKCRDKSTGKVVTILSCEPMRVEEVTEEDLVKLGIILPPTEIFPLVNREDKLRKAFLQYWHNRHPGKSWAWRVEGMEDKVR